MHQALKETLARAYDTTQIKSIKVVESMTDEEQTNKRNTDVDKPNFDLDADELKIPEHLEKIVQDADERNIFDEKAKEAVETFLTNFAEKLAAKEYSELTPTRVIEHVIKVNNETPIRQKCRPVPQAKKEILKQKLTELSKAGLIRRSFSPWRSPVHMVSKDGKDDRLTIDYRLLNDVTVKDSFPLPNIKEILVDLIDAKWFTKMDLIAGYFQAFLEKNSIKYSAFACEFGLFEWLVMPMGLTNATATFQRLMNHIFADFIDWFIKVYLDNSLVYSKTLREHIKHVLMVLIRLHKYKLKIKLSKCQFAKLEIDFLGHRISFNFIRPTQEKITKVLCFKEPNSLKTVRAFIGLTSYYKLFGKDFSTIAAPLYKCAGGKNSMERRMPRSV